MSAALALVADVAMMTLGGSLKRRERISARLGDVLSELYLASAVLKRYHDDGEPAADYPLVRWALQDGLYRMQAALRALYRNLPSRPLAWLLRLLTFPTGMPFFEPTDRTAQATTRLLLAPSPTRERLTQGVFIDPDERSRTRLLERALAAAQAIAPLEARLAELRKAGKLAAHDPQGRGSPRERHDSMDGGGRAASGTAAEEPVRDDPQGRGSPGRRQEPVRDDLASLTEESYGQGLIGAGERLQVRGYLALVDEVVRVDAFAGFADLQIVPASPLLGLSVGPGMSTVPGGSAGDCSWPTGTWDMSGMQEQFRASIPGMSTVPGGHVRIGPASRPVGPLTAPLKELRS
jgi:hypothetical protein